MQAREKVGLKMNVPKAKLAEITKILPAEKSPTISALAEADWVAVEVILEERLERDLVPQLKRAGASGIITYEQVGPDYPVKEIVTLPILEPKLDHGKVSGIFEICDPNFGNLWTNIPLSLFSESGFAYGDHLNLTIRHAGKVVFSEKLLFHQSFGFAQKGEAIIYNNELMMVALAVNQGSFSERYQLGYGPDWQIEFSK